MSKPHITPKQNNIILIEELNLGEYATIIDGVHVNAADITDEVCLCLDEEVILISGPNAGTALHNSYRARRLKPEDQITLTIQSS